MEVHEMGGGSVRGSGGGEMDGKMRREEQWERYPVEKYASRGAVAADEDGKREEAGGFV